MKRNKKNQNKPLEQDDLAKKLLDDSERALEESKKALEDSLRCAEQIDKILEQARDVISNTDKELQELGAQVTPSKASVEDAESKLKKIIRGDIDTVMQLIRYSIEDFSVNMNGIHDKSTSLELDRILSIVCKAFNTTEQKLRGPISAKTRAMQACLVGVSCLYNDHTYGSDISKYFGRARTFAYAAKQFIKLCISTKDKRSYPQLVMIIAECEEASNGRIKKNISLNLKHKDVVVLSAVGFKLNSYQISRIPVRTEEWLNNGNKKIALAAYNTKTGDVKYVQSNNWPGDRHLHDLQNFGYRYIPYSYQDHKVFESMNPMCDRCIKKIDCPIKADRFKVAEEKIKGFRCFKGTDVEGIDPKLLTLPYYSAQ